MTDIDSDAQRNRLLFRSFRRDGWQWLILQNSLNALGHSRSLVGRQIRTEHGKFISANAINVVSSANLLSNGTDDMFQGVVPDCVGIAIIDALKVVHVKTDADDGH